MTIRWRLTAWYALVLATLLIGLSVAWYGMLARSTLQRIDRTLQETARAFAAAWIAQGAAGPGDLSRPLESLSRFAAGDLEIVVLDRTNGIVARMPGRGRDIMDRAPRPRLLALVSQVAGARGVLATLPGDDAPRRAFAMGTQIGDRRQVVVVAQRLADREALLRAARVASTVSIAAALLLAFTGGYFLAARALAPVGLLAARAQRISASTLHERVPAPNQRDELGQLAGAFNGLLARLERAFEQQRQFMADASHELRTPIAVVRGEADVALGRRDRPAEEYRESLTVIRDEARRMSRLVDDLLLLARSDAGGEPLTVAELYLGDLVADAVRSLRALAAERGVSVHYESDGDLPMRGDETLLRRAVTNLLDNAIKHGGANGDVIVRAVGDATARYAVTVKDTGPGIPVEIRERLFDRFVRGPQPGATSGGGTGLGLAIARRIAEAHGGTLELVRSGQDGSEFRMTVPRTSIADYADGPTLPRDHAAHEGHQ